MENDPRCCGTGTCIIDPDGLCWCGQKWDGEKMSRQKWIDAAAPNPAMRVSAAPQPAPQTLPQ